MKALLIQLDFDGTLVEHSFPKIGRENFGWEPVIRKLMLAGHKVVLNTYRADIGQDGLDKASDWLNNHYRYDDLPYKILSNKAKIPPPPFDIPAAIEDGILWIDDQATDAPLRPCAMNHGFMIDWVMLDSLFRLYNVYDPVDGTPKPEVKIERTCDIDNAECLRTGYCTGEC